MANEKQDFGTIIEQWFKRFELISKEDIRENIIVANTYPIVSVHMDERMIAVIGVNGEYEYFSFENVPDYFEIRIRET